MPETALCQLCGRPFPQEEMEYQPQRGGLVCKPCLNLVDPPPVPVVSGSLQPDILDELRIQSKLLELIRENTHKTGHWVAILGVLAILALIGGCIAAIADGP